MATILITGATGLLAPYLADAMQDLGRVITSSRTGGDVSCDLTKPQSADDLLGSTQPDIIVHSAAMTDVDACEAEPHKAHLLNCLATRTLASYSAEHGSRLIYISTDQVYSGTHDNNCEDDQANPINVYGQTKLDGERAVVSTPGNLAFRTNIFGPSKTQGRKSLSDFFLEKLKNQEPITLFDDMFFSPLHMQTLGAYVVQAARNGLEGVFNLGCRDGMSKKKFCLAIARHYNFETTHAQTAHGANIPGRAPRPADLRLNVARIEAALGVQMPTLEDEIRKLGA